MSADSRVSMSAWLDWLRQVWAVARLTPGRRADVSYAARLDGTMQRISAISGRSAASVDQEVHVRYMMRRDGDLLGVAHDLERDAAAGRWP